MDPANQKGPHGGYSQRDAKLISIGDEEWDWLNKNLNVFLDHIDRTELVKVFSDRSQWQLLVARSPQEKIQRPIKSIHSFYSGVWETELGQGGLIGDLLARSRIASLSRVGPRRFLDTRLKILDLFLQFELLGGIGRDRLGLLHRSELAAE